MTLQPKKKNYKYKNFDYEERGSQCIPLKDPTGKFLGISLHYLPLLFRPTRSPFKSYTSKSIAPLFQISKNHDVFEYFLSLCCVVYAPISL